MKLQVLYFAGLREALGVGSEVVDLTDELATVATLRAYLVEQGRAALATTRNLKVAVNQEMARPESAIRDGDEIAFFPPVTGG